MSQLEKILRGGVITGTTQPSYNGLLLDATNNVLYSSGDNQKLAVVGGGSLIVAQGNQTALTTLTTAQTGYTFTVPANSLNVVGKILQIEWNAIFSNSATTPAITVALKMGATSIVSVVGAANANSNSNSPISGSFLCVTTTAGTSGVLEAHGALNNCVSAAWSSGTAVATYLDGANGGATAYDMTAASTATITFAASGTITTLTPQFLIVEVVN